MPPEHRLQLSNDAQVKHIYKMLLLLRDMAELKGYGRPHAHEPHITFSYDYVDEWRCMIFTEIIPLRENWQSMYGAKKVYTFKAGTLDAVLKNVEAAIEDSYKEVLLKRLD
jgi:hypothetical protein